MKIFMRIFTVSAGVLATAFVLSCAPSASRADDSTLKNSTDQVESGAKSIGSGIEDTAKGVGNTVVAGAKTAGEKVKQASRDAEPEAKNAWGHVRDGAVSFGHSVKNFFTGLFGD